MRRSPAFLSICLLATLTVCATLPAVREAADQVKRTARDVSADLAPVRPLAEAATVTVRDLNARLPVVLDHLDAVLVRAEKTLGAYESLAAHARGKTVDGQPAAWVVNLKRWAWLLLPVTALPAWLLQVVLKSNHRALAPDQRCSLGQAQREISGAAQWLIRWWLKLLGRRW